MYMHGKFDFELAQRLWHILDNTWCIVKVEDAKIVYMQRKFDF